MWLNGQTLGEHSSGYTPQTYVLPVQLLQLRNNVLVVKADATQPDSWWYDGGGIYRHVTLSIITTPGPFFAINSLYSSGIVVGPVSWAGDVPSAAALVAIEATVTNPSSSAFKLQVYAFCFLLLPPVPAFF